MSWKCGKCDTIYSGSSVECPVCDDRGSGTVTARPSGPRRDDVAEESIKRLLPEGKEPEGGNSKRLLGALIGGGRGAGLTVVAVGLVWVINRLVLNGLCSIFPVVSGEDRFLGQMVLLGVAWLVAGWLTGLLLLLCKMEERRVLMWLLFWALFGLAGVVLLAWPVLGLGAILVGGLIDAVLHYFRCAGTDL